MLESRMKRSEEKLKSLVPGQTVGESLGQKFVKKDEKISDNVLELLRKKVDIEELEKLA